MFCTRNMCSISDLGSLCYVCAIYFSFASAALQQFFPRIFHCRGRINLEKCIHMFHHIFWRKVKSLLGSLYSGAYPEESVHMISALIAFGLEYVLRGGGVKYNHSLFYLIAAVSWNARVGKVLGGHLVQPSARHRHCNVPASAWHFSFVVDPPTCQC